MFRVRLLHFSIHFLWMPHLLLGQTHTGVEGKKPIGLTKTCVATSAHSIYPANIILKAAFGL